MQRVSALPRVSGAVAVVAVVAGLWLGVPAASAADASRGPADGDGLTPALAAIAAQLIDAAMIASSGGGATASAGAVLSATASGRAPASGGGPPAAERPRRLAVVRASVALREKPGAQAVVRVGPKTEFGSPRVLAVGARRGDWLGVVATERPNNRLGWVHRDSPALRLRRTRWSLHADLSDRTLTLRKDGRRVHRLTVAIGRPGSETPTGRFAVTDKLSGTSYGPYYGCCILALSGHQPKTPPGWTGGDRLAIHGTDTPSTIGMAASAGCLRASDAALRPLMAKVPLGTTAFIRR
jgi:L,D-transpeptidase catalytic domain